MAGYNHKEIEKKWQEKWGKDGLYRTPDVLEKPRRQGVGVPTEASGPRRQGVGVPTEASGKNFYTLVEFPYPSGDLHIGHWYAYSVPDVFARMKRMQGYNVLYPIGFDAFGLPAENAAIKHKVNPGEWTHKNIDRMRAQLKSIGASFDWDREVVACDPSYYRFTQWLFLQLFKKGLAYKKKAFVNWDPIDKTVLANEQVLPDGTAERSGAKVEKKELAQWFLKITDYADRLIDDLDALDWPEPIKEAQRNWIGRSEGALISFELRASSEKAQTSKLNPQSSLTVFTTRPDTLFGATYLVLAPEHPLVAELATGASNQKDIHQYIDVAVRKGELERQENKEKTGVELKGVKAINPGTEEEIPIFIADYVLSGYGTGAIMAVPAHDERDAEFAQTKNLPVRTVIAEDGMLIESGTFNGLSAEEAKKKITESVGGKITKTYRQRDWLISRQRYWGTPIPIVYDPGGNAHAVPDQHLPWLLPTDVDFTPTGEAPLARSKELKERTEKLFDKGWTPEVDTMDTFVDSSWYFYRYLDPKNPKEFSAKEKQKAWLPVARYSGGSEHTTVHLLFARFFAKALYDLGLVTESEPFKIRLNRGIILAEDGRKMSKRWGNVVNPDEEVLRVGADAVRTYLAFIGPYNEVGSFPWNTNGLIGVRRFLERVWNLREKVKKSEMTLHSSELETLLNQTIKKVGEDIESMKFNTSVSALMILSNEFQKLPAVPQEAYEIFLKLLAPFAPHITEELWEKLGHGASIHLESWPEYSPQKVTGGDVVIAIQRNGKTKAVVSISRGASEQQVISFLKENEKTASLVPENPQRIIFVPGKVINFIA